MYHEIVRFEEHGKIRRFLHKEGSDGIYQDKGGVITTYGLIKFFVEPFVPAPENMKTKPAKTLTQWCKSWLEAQDVNSQHA
jgi:hypothetical protein